MFEVVGPRFFETLQAVAKEKLGAEHECTLAVANAAKSGVQVDIEDAQACLSELSPQVVADLMEAVHKSMREDPQALLDHWDVQPHTRRPN